MSREGFKIAQFAPESLEVIRRVARLSVWVPDVGFFDADGIFHLELSGGVDEELPQDYADDPEPTEWQVKQIADAGLVPEDSEYTR